MKARNMSITELAKILDITADGLGRILSGKRPITGQLSRHIELLLSQPRDAVVSYRVNIPDERVEEICCDCRTEEERQAAITALIHHNLAQLAAIGAILSLSPEELKSLGLENRDAADDETGSKSQPR